MTAGHEWGTAPDFVGPRHELRERLLLDAFLGARPGRRVLDVGAGQGTFSARLAARGFSVVSADASPAAVEVLRTRLGGEVARADATALPFPDGSFDAVVLGEVLEHVEDDRGAVAETARVLRSGGVAALSVPGNPRLWGPSDDWAGHVRRYTRTALLETVAGGGLAVERCSAWGFPVSALYHRHVYERHLGRRGPVEPARRQRPAVVALGALLRLDRLFVGVERGSLGYLLVARRP
jgi:2-polyprenyl-3-methyl-5-hydroxy-6-metoxy-1,4-benzoquinol methylase